MVIYLIMNMQSGRKYIGSTIRSVERRWSDHLSSCYTKLIKSDLYDDMRELGRQAFAVSVLETVDNYDVLIAREIALIEHYGTLTPNGYNRVKGGSGNLGWKPSVETRERMSRWQRGRTLSPEVKAKVSASLLGNKRALGFKGRPAQNKGIPHTDATKLKMSASAVGQPWTEKERIGHLGLKRTPESKALIAKRKREWWASLTPEARELHIHKMKGLR